MDVIYTLLPYILVSVGFGIAYSLEMGNAKALQAG